LVLGAVGAVVAAACGTPCLDYAAAGLEIRVVDESDAAVCDVDIVIRDGTYEEVPEVLNCSWSGAWERLGNYTIYAYRGNRLLTSKTARVRDEDSCGHVHTQEVTLVVSE
jgi:hypothetical protein